MSELISNISYTNKDFNTIYPELLDLVKKLTYKWDPSISNESDPGVILIKLNALIADKCNYVSDKNVLETFPASVTQESNARQLYEQLGYYMHWYESALVNVDISYNNTDTQYVESEYCTIPTFTMISDETNNLVYTLLGTSGTFVPTSGTNLLFDGTVQTFDAIQGVPVKYDINGKNVITAANLDSNNRLYFSTSDIAQNGIFITHTNGANDYADWVRKDNLYVESLGNTYYKFGVLPGTNTCYVEFPADAENIFSDGIELVYIRTSGTLGNAAAFSLEKFYEDTTVNTSLSDTPTIVLNQTNTNIVNISSSFGAKDKETISEAYKGYQSVIGTYKTLVTLRDYINAAINSGLVSNAIVSDRYSDIQCSYDIMTYSNYSNTAVTVVELDENSNPYLTAFDLKLYLLQYVSDNINTANKYNNTFNLQSETELQLYKDYIQDVKAIPHDYSALLTPTSQQSHFCLFKNKYPLSIRVLSKYRISDTEISEISNKIASALYREFNSKMVNFGEGIELYDVSQVISTADSRISDCMLYPFSYQTYAVYWNGEKFREIALDSESSVLVDLSDAPGISMIDINPGFAIKQEAETYDATNTYNKDYVVKYSTKYYLCKQDGVTGSWDSSKWTEITNYASTQTYAVGSAVFNRDYVYRNIQAVSNSPWSDDDWKAITVNNINEHTWKYYRIRYQSGSWSQIKYSADSEYEPLDSVAPYFDSSTVRGYISDNDSITIEVNPASQFRNEIYVKSVLAGKTPLLQKDNEFNYNLNQGGEFTVIDNINKIRTNLDITIGTAPDSVPSNMYKLRENEILQFFAPNLPEKVTYSKSSVKYDYNLPAAVGETSATVRIPANTNYELKTGEYIGLYWKSSSLDDALYQYYIYGEGNIICPTFDITVGTPTQGASGDYDQLRWHRPQRPASASRLILAASTQMTGNISSSDSYIVDNNFSNRLSDTKSITAKAFNTILLKDTMQAYWVLNSQTDENSRYPNSFILFNEATFANYDDTATYNVGDIVAYTDSNDQTQYWECIEEISTAEAWTPEHWTLSEYSQRILNSGEYFLYANSDLSTFNILGSGSRITRANSSSAWTVRVISLEDINANGASAIANNWFTLPFGANVRVQEQKFYNVAAGCTVKIEGQSENIEFNSDKLTSLAGYTISYATVDNPTSVDFIQLPGLVTNDPTYGTYTGRSSLYVNCGLDKEQILLDNQSIEIFQQDSPTSTLIQGQAYNQDDPDEPYYPVVIQFENEVNTQNSSGDFYVTSTSNDGTTIYNKLYKYSEYTGKGNTSGNPVVKYLDTGETELYFYPTEIGTAVNITLTFNVPAAQGSSGYILPLYNDYDEDVLGLTVLLDGTDVYGFQSDVSDFSAKGVYYLDLGITDIGTDHTLIISGTFNSLEEKVIKLGDLYKYKFDENISEYKYALYLDLIKNVFDKTNLFNYTYEVPENDLIVDPLNPSSFLDMNHVFNSYTICQMDLSNLDVTVVSR